MFKTKKDFDSLRDLGRQLSSSTLKDSIIISNSARNLTQSERISVFAYDLKSSKLWTLYADGVHRIEISPDTGIAGHVFTTGRTYYTNNPAEDPYYYSEIERREQYPIRSIAAVPIIGFVGRPVGVLQVINKIGGSFDEDDINALKFFSNFLSSFLDLELIS